MLQLILINACTCAYTCRYRSFSVTAFLNRQNKSLISSTCIPRCEVHMIWLAWGCFHRRVALPTTRPPPSADSMFQMCIAYGITITNWVGPGLTFEQVTIVSLLNLRCSTASQWWTRVLIIRPVFTSQTLLSKAEECQECN